MVKELYVEKFRLMEKLTIPLGKKITVIAGQNATCKSTLLGMIGQPFGLKKEKTIFNKSFSTKFADIFKMSKNFDKVGNHEYQVKFYDEQLFGKEIEYVNSFPRGPEDASHIRLVTGKTRKKGEGNLDYPVIYLGLKRVFPIGELESISKSQPTLTAQEIDTFNTWYGEIFVPLNATVSPVQITSKSQKDTLAVNSEQYDYYANSAGEDNIGQILGAIISFERLKNRLGDAYKGGLLLIDEIEATLFPAAQVNLVDLFYNLAGKLNLQFVFTTHSLDVLEHVINERQQNNGETEVLYFTRVYGKLDLIPDPSMDRIRSDLKIITLNPKKIQKLNIYCEDIEASWFTKQLLGSKWMKCLKFRNETFSGDLLYTFASKLTEFNDSIFILDGDKSNKKHLKNVILLPGNERPENVFMDLLESLPLNDPFWINNYLYTKQVFKQNLSDLTNGCYDNRIKMKDWFNNEKQYWGHNARNIYKLWLEKNSDLAKKFVDDFIKTYNNIARHKSIPLIKS
jgi:predicted ATPase